MYRCGKITYMQKFNPHYELTVTYWENGQTAISTITDPISIRFNISKDTFQSSNTAHITVYNMDIRTREGLYQDRLLFNQEKTKTVTLSAGYGNELTLVCFGYIQQCSSTRQGNDIVTEIDVMDPDILTQYTSKTFKAGTQKKEAYLNMLREGLPNIEEGEGTQSIDGAFEINTVFDGFSFYMINQITGDHTFIDDGKLHTLYDHQTIGNYGVYYISSETGMLATPVRQDGILQIKMLFEPTIKIGQLVEVKTETAYNRSATDPTRSAFDGQYKVIGLTHDCSISQSEGGSRITTLNLLYLEYLQNANVAYTNNPSGSQPTKLENGREIPIYGTITSDVKSIYDYIRKNGGAVPTTPLSSKVSWKEMIYPTGTQNRPADVMADVTQQSLANCSEIATQLSDFCAVHFPGKSVKILSGYRTGANNQRLVQQGLASSNSNHLYGAAIDFKIEGVSMAEQSQIFKQYWKGGLGTYNNLLHVSLKSKERFERR